MTIFKNLNEAQIIGKIAKKENWSKFNKKFKCIGRVRVVTLKEYINHLKDTDVIGFYIDEVNKNMTPLHSRGWLLQPRLAGDDTDLIIEYDDKEIKEKMIIENL